MPLIIFSFPNTVNVSVQVGDVAWFVPGVNTTTLPAFTGTGQLTEMGLITEVGADFIVVDVSSALWNSNTPPAAGDFIMFAKDNQANMGSLLGYYAKFRFKNKSYNPGELFSVGVEYFESSK
tara:strand:- start:605 stop:970 length:366 start_codon:yes stop_codon:yes gene_type:complete